VPNGWLVGDISHNGGWVPSQNQVVFGPFSDNVARTFSYWVMPPMDAIGVGEFDGNVTDGKSNFKVFCCLQTLAGSTAGLVQFNIYADNTLIPANPNPTGGTGLMDDINTDNVGNIMVYGMGLDAAQVFTAMEKDALTSTVLAGDEFCFTYNRSKSATALTFTVQKWEGGVWVDVNEIHTVDSDNGDTWTIKVCVPTGGLQSLLLRLVMAGIP